MPRNAAAAVVDNILFAPAKAPSIRKGLAIENVETLALFPCSSTGTL
jgi:hypothetical protein